MLKKHLAVGFSTATAAAVADFAFMSFTPVACGCESIPDLLLASAGLSYPAHLPEPQVLEAGLNRNLRGQVVRGGGDPYYFSSCKQESQTRVLCHIATDRSRMQERGYDIVFETEPSGTFIKSQVSRYTAWL